MEDNTALENGTGLGVSGLVLARGNRLWSNNGAGVTISGSTVENSDIWDNGRGIDWKKIAAKAQSMGLGGQSNEDLLFADGLSTADQVTEVSGRGVGMGALREATIALGGKIHVSSRLGTGTTLRMVFPERATMPGLYEPTTTFPKAA